MLYKNLIEGGILFMLPIYILWVVNLLLIGLLVYRNVKIASNPEVKTKPLSETILFLGSLAFLWGVLGQVTGMLQALGVIHEVGDISPALIAGGFQISLLAPVYGFVLLIVSYVFWYVNRRFGK